MQTILIIDDDAAIGDLEQEVLERAGYAVQRAYSGTEALLLLKSTRPALILLDLMLPGLSGEEVLPQIQGIPVMVVSAKAAVQDKVDLLLGGAADYLTKPFDTKELLARVAVRLREASRSPLAASYTCGGLTLDTASHQVCAGGIPVQLTRTEYAILKLLMQNPGQVLAKSVLLDRISEDTPPLSGRSRRPHRDTSPGSTARTASRIATPHKLFSWISLLYPRFLTRERGHFFGTAALCRPALFFQDTSSAVRRSEGRPYRCWISTILNNTTGSMLGRPLSSQ